jgi:hypothetical protein
MSTDLPLMLQTAYAEMLDRVRMDAFGSAFPAGGVFTSKQQRGRRYWYFQNDSANGRKQLYVGPETPELLAQIEAHKAAKTYARDRRSLVAMLVRVGRLPRPIAPIGTVVQALAEAGVFRLRAVLVGTVAYQTYSGMLGVRLPEAMVQTDDIDVAQFADVSAAIGDTTRPMADVLRDADASFRPIPHIHPVKATRYVAASGLKVDFLTPNRGRETEEPQMLRALGTDAEPLRFLDFLIRNPEPAILLSDCGVLVTVPAPERFAVHKLIVARRRREGDAKRDKDRLQAEALLKILIRARPEELRSAWREAFGRGKSWQRYLGEGLGLLHPEVRDGVLRVVGAARSIIPGLELQFVPDKTVYDHEEEQIHFFAMVSINGSRSSGIRCCITREALEVLAQASGTGPTSYLETFRNNQTFIEQRARTKYLDGMIDFDEGVTLGPADMRST